MTRIDVISGIVLLYLGVNALVQFTPEQLLAIWSVLPFIHL